MIGVSLTFFTDAVKLLRKQHGERYTGPSMEQLRAGLEMAEQAYLALPKVEKKKKPRKASNENSRP